MARCLSLSVALCVLLISTAADLPSAAPDSTSPDHQNHCLLAYRESSAAIVGNGHVTRSDDRPSVRGRCARADGLSIGAPRVAAAVLLTLS